jgi:hypothetical protein
MSADLKRWISTIQIFDAAGFATLLYYARNEEDLKNSGDDKEPLASPGGTTEADPNSTARSDDAGESPQVRTP